MKKFLGLMLSALVVTSCTSVDTSQSQGGLYSGATYGGTTYGGGDWPPGDPPGGTCPDGSCSDPECSEFWTVPVTVTNPTPPTPTPDPTPTPTPTPTPIPAPVPVPVSDVAHGASAASGTIRVMAGEELTAEVAKDGTIIIRDSAGRIVETLRGVLAKLPGGGWIIKQTPGRAVPEILNRVKVWRFAKCIGVISAMLLLTELTYAGMEAALGPAAEQMGIRLVECRERFAKAVGGIQCLLRKQSTTTCAQAVTDCPDAFFGANLIQSCGTEPGMNELVDSLIAAIQNTSVLSGGRGYLNPDTAGLLNDAIRNGTIATSPEMTCTLRTVTQGCQFLPGSIYPAPAGWNEAKACWDGASRGVFDWKYAQAQRCCGGNAACLQQLAPMQNC